MAIGCVLPWAQANGIASLSVSAVTVVGKDLTGTAAVVAAIVAVIAGVAMAAGAGGAAGAGWRIALIAASIACVASVSIELLQFMSAKQSLGPFASLADLVSPGIGLFVTGIAGLGGLVAAFLAGGSAEDRGAAPHPDVVPDVDLGHWVVAQSTGYAIDPGTRATLKVLGAWVEAQASGWLQSFPSREDYVQVVAGRLDLRNASGSSVTLTPAGGQDVALIRSLIIHPN
jgi:hypothetical protein